jgi:uncharacterized protein
MLIELAKAWQRSVGILHKQDIQVAARLLKSLTSASPAPLQWGDDCAAIADGDSYLLLAAEGLLPAFVASDPWFAGWCAVMVNVSDVYAMGGRPIAVVDTVWSQSADLGQSLLQGMQAAAHAYNVPIVGGHTNAHSPYDAVSVAILGRAHRLLTSFNAQPGDVLLAAIDPRGVLHPHYPFWNATTTAAPERLRADLELLPQLAETQLCDAGKDISMGGILGTTLMLLETSHCGATLRLDGLTGFAGCPLEQWLVCFPSYGFLLSVRPDRVEAVRALFQARDLWCEAIGKVESGHQLYLQLGNETVPFWDLSRQSLTGFAPADRD